MAKPRIIQHKALKMLGMKISTNLAENRTRELWRNFKPRVKEIEHRAGKDYYSIQEYPKDIQMDKFTSHTQFTKWAAVRVLEFENIPSGMDRLIIPAGIYAIFTHKGPIHTFYKTSQYIYGQWLPGSDYLLDQRPQFEIMSEKYLGPDHPDSEEEVWIPIRPDL
jgi:AraC family transcriptional regulator